MISKLSRSTSYDYGKKSIAKLFDGSQVCDDNYKDLHVFRWNLQDPKVDANIVVMESVDAVFLLK